jgi:hypothetical protein
MEIHGQPEFLSPFFSPEIGGTRVPVFLWRNGMDGDNIQAMTHNFKEFDMALTDTAVRQAKATGKAYTKLRSIGSQYSSLTCQDFSHFFRITMV